MEKIDWKAVADEIYMFLVGYFIGMPKDDIEAEKRMEKMRHLREEIIKANTKEVKSR